MVILLFYFQKQVLYFNLNRCLKMKPNLEQANYHYEEKYINFKQFHITMKYFLDQK